MIIEAEKYYQLINPKYISWDFYSDYIEEEPPFGELGVIVFLRTYSRFIESLQRREYWREVCLRVVEYSLSLDTVSKEEWKIEEAEHLFDAMFKLQGFPAGRSLWTAGTKQSEVDSSCAWNCTFRVIDDISSFSEIFYWLMIGAGTGFSIEEKHISKLPTFKRIPIEHIPYNEIKESLRYENTNVSWLKSSNSQYFHNRYDKDSLTKSDSILLGTLVSVEGEVTISIGDSKEGWCNALRIYLLLLSSNKNVTNIIFNYNNIRPEGTRIKTFGGRSSGHQVLIELFNNIINIISEYNGTLTSVNVLDIVNSIGLGVVSGGVRRTAQIALGDSKDNEFKEAKVDLWTDPKKEKYCKTRPMSNNSTLNYTKPSFEEITDTFECLKSQGDPGFWNIGASKKLAESPVAGTNPCGER